MKTIMESFEKVSKKQKLLALETDEGLDKIISKLSNFNQNNSDLNQLLQETKSLATKLTDNGKDFYTVLGKHSKVLEKRFKTDLDNIWDPKALVGKDHAMYSILIHHFVREGRFDLAKLFAKEAGIEFENNLHNQFEGMYHIQEALRVENPGPAIEWATTNRKKLQQVGSTFEFKLHQLQYLSHIKRGDIKAGLNYAKSHFGYFADKHIKEIQRLMCCILFSKRLENSPYAAFAGQGLWMDIQVQFSRDFCHILGQSCESPLFTCVTVGSSALPMIMKISSLMKDKALEWSQTGELPVTIPLLDSQRYHSIFVCPVTKEQGTELNPPMMMACGHVISGESLLRLSKGNINSRFKCPYCPIDSTAAQAVRVYF
ncbi:binding protein [Globomyces pollinis-pini]|nr:binding protein [Globomyces pollinis-pini]KAI8897540.1 binding protein [Globomyces pollinis-pini]